ncbi:type I-E CRISPR-associated protein Cas6/Cse3/CasE [Oceanobacter kriegii]|uniref:type I-E CRISPR-associated protein Cas6/Cse3/CasE n=1 Tax=Oceanobacter kriegii TaxID=64972 RepID=UPI000424D6E1|nr:type I-E CRISPR-associated protein Cas6/Cse3/CasE [Oceanobacter kriegii]
MYFSKVTVANALELSTLLADFKNRDSYIIHQLLWQLFPGYTKSWTQQPSKAKEQLQRPFLYREETNSQGFPEFYVLSEHPPEAKGTPFNCQTKHYEPRLSAGDRLAFKLRVNPVTSSRDEQGIRKRHDVLMDAKRKVDPEGLSPERLKEAKKLAAEHAAQAWISSPERLADWGVQLDSQPEIESYTQHRLARKKALEGERKNEQGRPIRYSSVDYQGLLTVTDPERFLQALYKGVGKSKGFGCGMWLVRRV